MVVDAKKIDHPAASLRFQFELEKLNRKNGDQNNYNENLPKNKVEQSENNTNWYEFWEKSNGKSNQQKKRRKNNNRSEE